LELTPDEQAQIEKLDSDLQHTKTIDSLKQGQEEIRNDIQSEREFNKSEFAKGTEKFKELFGELKEVRIEVGDMKTQISDGFKQQRDDLAKHLAETKDNQITDLKASIEKRDETDTKKRDRVNALKDGILVTLIGGILLATAIYFLIPTK